ncbi:SIS domain-containing protein [Streptomyces sp. NPDC032472]|uniref:SIS domain-containing protein n=1 Tax=Streptomyces sp. NPDC032472 TaxID=3155018 RepID=UPI0033D31E4C
MAATVTPERLRTAAGLIDAAPRVRVLGAGLSGAVALDTAYRLRALGCAVDAPADPLTAQLAASQADIRRSLPGHQPYGRHAHTVHAARGARRAGAKVNALTSYARSPLSESSDCTLVAGGQDLVFGLETVASRLAHLTVVDALTLTLLGLRGAPAEAALRMSADVTVDHSY